MLFKNRIFGLLFAALSLVPAAFMASSAVAQTGVPVITGFDVEQARRLTPGTSLVFTLRGTPGATARIAIDGVRGEYYLNELDPGLYQGSYTLRTTDKVTATTGVTANLRLNNQIATAVLDESLLAGAPWRTAAQRAADAAAAAPRIDRFEVIPANPLTAGANLVFIVYGTPGAQVSVRTNGAQGKTNLAETTAGRYEGSYRLVASDRVTPSSRTTATLRSGDRTVTAALAQPLLASGPTLPAGTRAPCPNCGVVEAVNVVEVKGPGSYVGLIAGGLAGAVLGNQVGKGTGRTAASVLGAAGGAYAGREIEKNVRKEKHWEVVTRLEGGGVQTINYETDPGFAVGERVRVENNALVRN